jgi:hypothetical protein
VCDVCQLAALRIQQEHAVVTREHKLVAAVSDLQVQAALTVHEAAQMRHTNM